MPDDFTLGARVSRRALISAPLALAAPAAPRIRREVFRASPREGVAIMAYAFYTSKRGGHMISLEERWTRSDTIDVAYVRRSSDHGRSWSHPLEMRTGERHPEGMLRRHPRAGFVDSRGRYIEFWVEGILPTDNPIEGLRAWNIFYRVSRDGSRTFGPSRQIVHSGSGFDARHPLPGVWTGKNCVMLGDMPCTPLEAADGTVLLPVQISPLAPDGTLDNPGGGYTYTDCAVLRGRWIGNELEWEMSDSVKGDPARSTRGMDEGTLGFLNGSRLLMVMRGSNQGNPDLPGYRWFSLSSDGGRRWTAPEPWSYTDGQPFFSPGSCSQLVDHSSGRLLWLGNITGSNPRGNRPRYPFVIGEVNPSSGLLKRENVTTIDTLQPGEDPILSLSNFFAREDRVTGGLAVHMTRLFAGSGPWSGDSNVYHLTF